MQQNPDIQKLDVQLAQEGKRYDAAKLSMQQTYDKLTEIEGVAEVKNRATGERQDVALDQVAAVLTEKVIAQR